jgi:hypothetical protein
MRQASSFGMRRKKMKDQETGSERKWTTSVVNGLRHPLTLLIIGSLLGSFLIPYINSLSNRRQLLREARLKKVLEILHNNSGIKSQLNVMRTRLGMFHQDNLRQKPSPTELKQRQDKLAEDINERYLEFDKVAWWWHKDLYQEAIILEITTPDGSQKLAASLSEYGKNVEESVNALNVFWAACLSRDYDWKESEKVIQIVKEMDKKWADLDSRREKLVSDIVRDFTAPQQ